MKNILPGLHSLRGLAALSIVIFHVLGIPQLEIPGYLSFVKNYFGFGVTLFFIISAFSLFLSTFNRVGSQGWLYAYFIKRIFRIAPLFYLMLGIYLVYLYVNFGVVFSLDEIIINITFLYNFFPGKHGGIVWAGWTLGVEMLFYAIVPYLLMTTRSFYKSLIVCFIFTTISIISGKMYAQMELPPGFAYLSFLFQAGTFAFGIPAYFIYEKYKNHEKAALIGKCLLVMAIILMTIMTTKPHLVIAAFGDRYYPWVFVFTVLILSQTLSPFVLLTNRLFTYLGNLSFSLYLLHPLIINFLKPAYLSFYDLDINPAFSFLLSVILTLIVLIPIAHGVYTYVEINGIKMGSALIRRKMKSFEKEDSAAVSAEHFSEKIVESKVVSNSEQLTI